MTNEKYKEICALNRKHIEWLEEKQIWAFIRRCRDEGTGGKVELDFNKLGEFINKRKIQN